MQSLALPIGKRAVAPGAAGTAAWPLWMAYLGALLAAALAGSRNPASGIALHLALMVALVLQASRAA